MKWIYALISLLVICSCNKVHYYPDLPVEKVKTRILGHRGSGAFNPDYQHNTLVAAKNGLQKMDGIEVDVQISKDATIWLEHDVDLIACDDLNLICFPNAKDSEIIELDSCRGDQFDYSTLESIFSYMSANYPSKHITIDVKAWIPCRPGSAGILGMMNLIGDEIIRLSKKYDLENQVMVESQTATFLKYIKKHNKKIDCYLVSFGDFERAMLLSLEADFDGIAFKYKFKEEISSEHINLVRKKGLKVQLFTVNEPENIEEALSINPDYIQTDNLEYFE